MSTDTTTAPTEIAAISDLADRMAGRALGPLPIHHPGLLAEGAETIRALVTRVTTLTEAAEEDAEFASAIVKAICDHVGLDPDPEGYTTADLESLLEEHNDGFDRLCVEHKTFKTLATELASEMVRVHRHMGDLLAATDPGADAFASHHCVGLLLARARSAGLLPVDAKATTAQAQAESRTVTFTAPAALHTNTLTLIADFASALATKLRKVEIKRGWTASWMRKGWRDELAAELLRHVHKGDPVDVAAYCAFAWFHGWDVSPCQPQGAAPTQQHQPQPADAVGEVVEAAQRFIDAVDAEREHPQSVRLSAAVFDTRNRLAAALRSRQSGEARS